MTGPVHDLSQCAFKELANIKIDSDFQIWIPNIKVIVSEYMEYILLSFINYWNKWFQSYSYLTCSHIHESSVVDDESCPGLWSPRWGRGGYSWTYLYYFWVRPKYTFTRICLRLLSTWLSLTNEIKPHWYQLFIAALVLLLWRQSEEGLTNSAGPDHTPPNAVEWRHEREPCGVRLLS